MRYKEQIISRVIYTSRNLVQKFYFCLRKIKKIWLQREEYMRVHCLKGKNKSIQKSMQMQKLMHKIPSEKNGNFEKGLDSKLAVYTCIFGEYDKIKEPLFKSKYCDYYIVTDQEIASKSIWTKITPAFVPEGFESWHPAVKNRYYKMHPQDLFPAYEFSLYIDGNIQPITDLYPFVIQMKSETKEIGLFQHPIFQCLYDSSEHLKKIDLVDSEIMDMQVQNYQQKGFPKRFGFFECNLILRKHLSKKCCSVMETWWEEYKRGVKRDQQSFTYALWENGMQAKDICVFGQNIRKNSRVKLHSHKTVHEKVLC